MFKKSSTTHCHSLLLSIKLFSLLSFSLWLTACQAPPLHVNASMKEGVDLSQYQTFTIPDVGGVDNEYYDDINQGIIKNLTGKGYRLAEQADLVVRYTLEFSADKQLELKHIPDQGNTHTEASMEAVYEAFMLVNIIDTQTKQVIWKASSTRNLKNVDFDDVDQKRVNDSIAELFESFPAR